MSITVTATEIAHTFGRVSFDAGCPLKQTLLEARGEGLDRAAVHDGWRAGLAARGRVAPTFVGDAGRIDGALAASSGRADTDSFHRRLGRDLAESDWPVYRRAFRLGHDAEMAARRQHEAACPGAIAARAPR